MPRRRTPSGPGQHPGGARTHPHSAVGGTNSLTASGEGRKCLTLGPVGAGSAAKRVVSEGTTLLLCNGGAWT